MGFHEETVANQAVVEFKERSTNIYTRGNVSDFQHFAKFVNISK
jgi:hypothetical protein